MAFYENTIVAKQDLAEKELKTIKEKYNELINKSSGKVIKIEEWGLLNLANKNKNYRKGFYIHYKFEGNNDTLNEIEKKIKVSRADPNVDETRGGTHHLNFLKKWNT